MCIPKHELQNLLTNQYEMFQEIQTELLLRPDDEQLHARHFTGWLLNRQRRDVLHAMFCTCFKRLLCRYNEMFQLYCIAKPPFAWPAES